MRVGKNFTAGLIVVALVLIVWAPGRAADPPLGGARISAVEGEALVQPGEGEGWRAAPLNMPLLPGDRVQTGAQGHLEVLFSNGAAVRVAPDSAVRLVAVPPADPAGEPTAAAAELEAGRANLATAEGDPSRPAMILDSTGTRVSIFPRSQLRAETVAPDATQLMLREGAAAVETLGASIPLQGGEALQVGPGGASRVASLPPDAFDHWSDGRNRALAAAPPTSPYVPAPLAPSTAELNRYGRWTTVPEYGSVWQPTAVPAGWAPFTVGDWVWRGETWVWVSAEPWGWVPFHYGRWRWDPLFGWYWVPPRPRLVVWDPGAVAWIATPTFVTWIPLAPGEVFFPPTTVINNINITNITVIHKTFVNAAAPVRVVAVPATAFTRTTVVAATAPTVTRVSLTNFVANQPARVVRPASLAPAVATRRPADHAPSAMAPAPGWRTDTGRGRAHPPGLTAPNTAPAQAGAPGTQAPASTSPTSPAAPLARGRTDSGWPVVPMQEGARPPVAAAPERAQGTPGFRTPQPPAPPMSPERPGPSAQAGGRQRRWAPETERRPLPPVQARAAGAGQGAAPTSPAAPAPSAPQRPLPEPRQEPPKGPTIQRNPAPPGGSPSNVAPAVPSPARPAPREWARPRQEPPNPQLRTEREWAGAERHNVQPALSGPQALAPARPPVPIPPPAAPPQAAPPARREPGPPPAPMRGPARQPHVAQAAQSPPHRGGRPQAQPAPQQAPAPPTR